jgi:hypothetical protein
MVRRQPILHCCVRDSQIFIAPVFETTLITDGNPYFGGSRTIPNRPHLILVPGTILGQWESEIKMVLNPKAFDLFIYTTGKAFREEFWSDEGPFSQSKQPAVNKIILASHSVRHLLPSLHLIP